MIENARSRHVEHQLSQQGEQLSLLQDETDSQNWLLLMVQKSGGNAPIDMVNILIIYRVSYM